MLIGSAPLDPFAPASSARRRQLSQVRGREVVPRERGLRIALEPLSEGLVAGEPPEEGVDVGQEGPPCRNPAGVRRA